MSSDIHHIARIECRRASKSPRRRTGPLLSLESSTSVDTAVFSFFNYGAVVVLSRLLLCACLVVVCFLAPPILLYFLSSAEWCFLFYIRSFLKFREFYSATAEYILSVYKGLGLDTNHQLKYMLIASPLSLILFLYMFVSQSTSSLISFSAFIISIVFLGVGLWILCEILMKDAGPKNMQEIAEVIKEGSEGFFIT